MPTKNQIGVALSGGGFRATLFHLGALYRLNEMGMLNRASTISSVSGGAIVAGILATRWPRLHFHDDVALNFKEEILKPTLDFCNQTIDVEAILWGLITPNNPLIDVYRSDLFGKKTLQDLPDNPTFLFNATHLETGKNLRFSKKEMRTYKLGYVPHPKIGIAEIVAASTAFPPLLSPVIIRVNPKHFQRYETNDYADLFHREDLKRKLSLSDAGIYDNLGVHAIRNLPIQLVSDASRPLMPVHNDWLESIWQFFNYRTLRTINIATDQIGNLRRQQLVKDFKTNKKGALWTIKTPINKYVTDQPINVHPCWADYLSAIPTRLKAFPTEIITRLINWGYLQCDLSIRANYNPAIPASNKLPIGSSEQFQTPPA